jgi:hypothetical protein
MSDLFSHLHKIVTTSLRMGNVPKSYGSTAAGPIPVLQILLAMQMAENSKPEE